MPRLIIVSCVHPDKYQLRENPVYGLLQNGSDYIRLTFHNHNQVLAKYFAICSSSLLHQ